MFNIKILLGYISMIFFMPCHMGQKPVYKFQKLIKDNGLLSNRISDIHQDKLGFMWFGTRDGLCRFNGYSYENFISDPDDPYSITNNKVTCITEDPSNGNLWVGTEKGLNYFNLEQNRFENDSIIEVLNTNLGLILCVFRDNYGNVWIGSDSLCKISAQKNIQFYKHTPQDSTSIRPGQVNAIYQDSRNRMIIGTAWNENSGLSLYNYNKNSFQHYKTDPVKHVTCIAGDRQNNLWIGTYDKGVYFYKNNVLNTATRNYAVENNYLINNWVQDITFDHRGNLFIADRDGGLINIDFNKDTVWKYVPDIFEPRSISSKAVMSVYVSQSGIIWVGTFNSGINYIDIHKKQFEHYTINFKENGLFNKNIRAVFEDEEGNIWVGTKENGGLSKFDRINGTFSHYKYNPQDPYGLHSDYIFSINEIDNQYLLLGTQNNGISIFDKHSGIFTNGISNYDYFKDGKNENIYAIYKDCKNNIWIGSNFFLEKFIPKDKTFQSFPEIKTIRCFCAEDSTRIWMGSKYNGLYCFNGEDYSHKRYFHEQNNRNFPILKDITGLTKDKNGNLWIATDGNGLVCLKKSCDEFSKYTSKNGLPSNSILGLLYDKNNTLWMSTANGISRFNLNNKQFRNYTVKDGLQGNEFSKSVALLTSDGEMLFGGSNGFNIFAPDSIKDNPVTPPVIITGLSLFNKLVEPREKGSPINKHISLCKHITFKHWQSNISFSFCALNYTNPRENKYAYMLKGFDNTWNFVDDKRKATYTNLAPGEYVFKVKASNNDGKWNKNGTSLRISVLPPWWDTYWFKTMAIIFSGGCMFFLYYLKVNSLQKQRIRLESEVRERTTELSEKNKLLHEQKEELISQTIQITEMNKDLQSRNNELKIKNEEIKKLAGQVHEADQKQLRFFTNISHEFRTPLTLIIGPLEKLIKSEINGKKNDWFDLKKYHHQMLRNAKRLLRLVNEIIDFRKLDQKAQTLNLSHNNIEGFIREVANTFSSMAESKNIHLSFNKDQETMINEKCKMINDFWFDPDVMEKILYNLISNAIKYTPEGGEIFLRLKVKSEELTVIDDDTSYSKTTHQQINTSTHQHNNQSGGQNSSLITHHLSLIIEISDTGIGIKPGHIDKIFDRFYRVETRHGASLPANQNKGTGIGLAFTKELVEFHNGKISVESKYHEGTSFTLSFPIENMKEVEKENKKIGPDNQRIQKHSFSFIKTALKDETKNKLFSNPSKKQGAKTTKDKSKPTILIVEDNAELRNFIIEELMEEYNFLEAENGLIGWEKSLEKTPDLIISDIMMPEIDGIELCYRLKNEETTSHTPVILLTAKSDQKSIISGLVSEPDDYICKPFDFEILNLKIKSVLNNRKRLKKKFCQSIKVSPTEITNSHIDQEFLEKAIEVVKKNMKVYDFDNDSFVEEMNYSKATVYRKIKSITGGSVSDFIRSIRLKTAAQLFLDGDDNISSVCFQVGFKNLAFFSQHFKKMFDCPPRQFIKDNVIKK